MQDTDSMNFAEKKAFYLAEIERIPVTAYNAEQKALAASIIERADERNLDALYTFITRRVKLGFVFDAAPEVNHNACALVKHDAALSFEAAELEVENGKLKDENPQLSTFNSPLFAQPLRHKLIVGENFDALKNLAVCYRGAVDFIYIDPPYNTESTQADGNDYKSEVQSAKFCYRDKFSRTGWLNMMRERLVLARKLLSERGAIFISIDDSEQAYLKVLCDEIFGEENFVACLIWQKKKGGGQDAEDFSKEHEYILCYKKKDWKIIDLTEKQTESDFTKIINGRNAKLLKLEKWGVGALRTDAPTLYYPIKDPKGNDFYPIAPNGADGRWRKKPENLDAEHIFWQENSKGRLTPYEVIYFDEITEDKIVKTRTIFTEQGTTTDATKMMADIFNGEKVFDYPKPVSLIKHLLKIACPAGNSEQCVVNSEQKSQTNRSPLPTDHCSLTTDHCPLTTNHCPLVLDFFAGSGTTAQAVMELNAEDGGRRVCILCTNDENGIASRVTRERLFRVTHGAGSNGQSIKWRYSAEQPFLAGNALDAFKIETHHLEIEDFDKAEKLVEEARKTFPLLREGWQPQSEFSIYDDLASLKPCEE